MLADETRSWYGNTTSELQHAGQKLCMIAHSFYHMMKCLSCSQATMTWTGLYRSAKSMDQLFSCEFSVEIGGKWASSPELILAKYCFPPILSVA